MGNDRRLEQKRFYQEMARVKKEPSNKELAKLAEEILAMAIRYGRRDIAKAVTALLKTIEQCGLDKAKECKKTQWLINFKNQMQGKQR